MAKQEGGAVEKLILLQIIPNQLNENFKKVLINQKPQFLNSVPSEIVVIFTN